MPHVYADGDTVTLSITVSRSAAEQFVAVLTGVAGPLDELREQIARALAGNKLGSVGEYSRSGEHSTRGLWFAEVESLESGPSSNIRRNARLNKCSGDFTTPGDDMPRNAGHGSGHR